MPTSLLGIAFYIFALFPGLAFAFAREGHQPAAKRSALRETATVVFVSVVCDAFVIVIFAILTIPFPSLERLLGVLLEGDISGFESQFRQIVLAALVSLAASTAIGFLLGTKGANDLGLSRLWASPIPRDTSAWGEIFSTDSSTEVLIGASLKSGAWVGGLLYAFDNAPEADPHRTITLAGELKYRPAGKKSLQTLDSTNYVILEAGEIEVLQATQREYSGSPAQVKSHSRRTSTVALAIVLVLQLASFTLLSLTFSGALSSVNRGYAYVATALFLIPEAALALQARREGSTGKVLAGAAVLLAGFEFLWLAIMRTANL